MPGGRTSSSNAIASDCIPSNQLYRQSASDGRQPNSVGDNQAGLLSYSGFQDAVLLLSSALALADILLTTYRVVIDLISERAKMCIVRIRKPLFAVIGAGIAAVVLIVVGFQFGNMMGDFTKNFFAGLSCILIAFVIAWLFIDKRASQLLGKIDKLLERDRQYQRSVQRSWAEKVLLPIAVRLLEVTHQLFHDLQNIEDNVSIGREDISQEAEKLLEEVSAFFRPNKDKFITINSAAANSLTQSSKLLDRLEAYLKAGPDWIRDDTQIAKLIQEAVTCMDNLPPSLFIYSNIHPEARRVRLQPGSFEKSVAEVHCTSLWQYLEQLANLTIAIDKKVHRE